MPLAVTILLVGCTQSMTPIKSDYPSHARHFAFRLHPGDELKSHLQQFVTDHHIRAAAIVTCVGSLTRANLRMADAKDGTVLEGKFEIVSLVGTLSPDGPHLHLAISDEKGTVSGGHVMEGCIVRTTVEIVIVELSDLEFRREQDMQTGYKELIIRAQNK
jgi:predicted DNA-binding protein with PD1-like motif